MAAHSSVLAWRIPGTAGPGGLLSMWSHRVGHDRSDLAAAACTFGRNANWTQPLWKTAWKFLKKLKIELSYNLEVPLLDIYLKKKNTN